MLMKTVSKMAAASMPTRSSPNNGKGATPARSRSDAMGQKSQVAGVFAATHTGPYLGKMSV